MFQIINEATYLTQTSANILDLVVDSGTLPPLGSSHHSVVYCEIQTSVIQRKSFTREIWKYNEANWDQLNADISAANLMECLSDNNTTDICYKKCLEKLFKLLERHITLKTVTIRPKDKPWITSDVKQKLSRRDRMFNKYKHSKNAHNYAILPRH
jgi:hypothetical protein